MLKNFASALGLVAIGTEAAPRLSRCPDFKPMAELDLTRYTGTWYEIHRDKFTPFEILLGCDVATYTARDDGSVTVQNQGHRPIQGWSGATGSAVQADTGDASLIVSFGGNTPSPSDKANYNILYTDYDTYTIVYSCSNILGVASFDLLWILAREPELDDSMMLEIIGKIEDQLPDYGFFKHTLETRQANRTCPYDKRPE